MLWEQKVEYAALSDIGFRRKNNEDSYVVQVATDRVQWDARGHLFLVADGMGGHAVGELASKIAADTIPHTYHKLNDLDVQAALEQAIRAGHDAIHLRGQQNLDFMKMGTTCTTLVLSRHGAVLGHVGDSRAYRIRGQRIEQLTFDHSLQWELLKQGRMSPEDIFLHEPRNVITRSLGPQPNVEIDIEGPYPVRPGDVYLMCSDGLSTLVSDEEMGVIARELPPVDACQFLVDLANLRGGTDNVTVIVARVGEIPAGLPDLAPPPDEYEQAGGWGWGWLLGFLGVGLTFIFGNALAALEKPLEGILLEGLGALGIAGMTIAWLRQRRLNLQNASLPEITPGTPYRTASAQVTRKFVSEIGALEYSLQRTAIEEDWTIEWRNHNIHYDAAKTALSERRYSDALREYAKTIHVLMGGIQLQRRQRDLAIRWKVKNPAERGAMPP